MARGFSPSPIPVAKRPANYLSGIAAGNMDLVLAAIEKARLAAGGGSDLKPVARNRKCYSAGTDLKRK